MTESKTHTESGYDTSFTLNRELSWLKFNQRVLAEADDLTVPLFEQLKFVSIFTSNLDEFFMIRVGSLQDVALLKEKHTDNKSGMTPRQQLEAVFQAVAPLYRKRDQACSRTEHMLRRYDICRLSHDELEPQEKKFIQSYFKTYVLPVLSPQIIDIHHPFPHLENKALSVVMMLREKSGARFGILPVPKIIPRMIFLPESLRFILAEEVVAAYAEEVFEHCAVTEKAIISVTRNADINPDDETYDFEEDFRLHMKKILKKRARLEAVRLEIQGRPENGVRVFLMEKLGLEGRQVYLSRSPLDLSYVFQLEDKLSPALRQRLTYGPFEPQHPPESAPGESVIRQILKRDLLLTYPYQGMDTFLRLIREAAADPAVISIKITLYRIDRKSRLAEALIAAAENGKDVTVVMELRARFDEQNNIDWAGRLQEAGCTVIYGSEGFKVHAKLCLITRHEKNRFQYLTQIGTGNYNEKTARLYTDFSLITANEAIGADAVVFFKNMLISNTDGSYESLLVAPVGLKRSLLALIDAEIEKRRLSRPAGILLKLNSLTDRDVIDRLSEASRAGVPIRLIIRGICCLVPGIPGKTEHITVRSIIGRYLEHARVYCFGAGDEMRVYIASADLMTRNTERRVETAYPILDEQVKRQILEQLSVQLSDNVKAWEMDAGGNYSKVTASGAEPVNSQAHFMDLFSRLGFARVPSVHTGKTSEGLVPLVRRLLQNRFSSH